MPINNTVSLWRGAVRFLTSSCLPALILLLPCPDPASAQARTETIAAPVHLDPVRKQSIIRALFAELGLPSISSFASEDLLRLRPEVRRWAEEQTQLTPIDPATDQIVKLTYPHLLERVARSTVHTAEFVQQPRTVLIQSNNALVPAPNPDKFLFRYSVATNYAELVPSAADVLEQAEAVHGAGLDIATSRNAICKDQTGAPPDKLLNCFLRIGTGNRFGRLLSGVTGTFDYGQNPRILFGLSVDGTAAAAKNFSLSGKLEFNPKTVILTGSDWLTAYQTAKLYGPAAESAMRDRVRRTCELTADSNGTAIKGSLLSASCLSKLSRPSGKTIAAIILLPQVTETIRNQFDFIQQNGTYVSAPYQTNSLQDITFSFDLTRLIPSAKSRSDALAMLSAMTKPIEAAKDHRRSAVAAMFQEMAWQPESVDSDEWYQNFFQSLLAACATVPTCAGQE